MKQLVLKAKQDTTNSFNKYQINGLILKQTLHTDRIFLQDLKSIL